MYSTDHNEILHTSRQCNCHDMYKISVWSVGHVLNFSTPKFLSNFEFDRNTVNKMGGAGKCQSQYTWTNAGLKKIGNLRTDFHEIWIKTQQGVQPAHIKFPDFSWNFIFPLPMLKLSFSSILPGLEILLFPDHWTPCKPKSSFYKLYHKTWSVKWCPFCLGLYELTHWPLGDFNLILGR